jgi:hypothetical protein
MPKSTTAIQVWSRALCQPQAVRSAAAALLVLRQSPMSIL